MLENTYKKKIFLDIDSVLTRILVKKWLVKKNAEVFCANQVKEQEKTLKEEDFDLYIFDITERDDPPLKYFDSAGYKVVNKKVLIIGENKERFVREELKNVKIDAYLQKPLKEEEFLKIVSELLEISKRENVFYFVKVARKENENDIAIARMIDLSETGCCLILPFEVKTGELVIIKGDRWNNYKSDILGEIARIRKRLARDSFSFECGVKFLDKQ